MIRNGIIFLLLFQFLFLIGYVDSKAEQEPEKIWEVTVDEGDMDYLSDFSVGKDGAIYFAGIYSNGHSYSWTTGKISKDGEITNYNMLRDSLELEGFTFHTDSDSEVIAVFLASKILKHGDIERAHREFVAKADGPFTYIAATVDSIAIVRDKFGTRKGIIGYNPGTNDHPSFWAMATDLSALDVVGATTKILSLK